MSRMLIHSLFCTVSYLLDVRLIDDTFDIQASSIDMLKISIYSHEVRTFANIMAVTV